jgi:cell wall-associated NlpC family hydrolase
VYTDTPDGVRPYGRTGAAALAALSVLATGAVVAGSPTSAFAAVPSSTFATRMSLVDSPLLVAQSWPIDKPSALRGPNAKMSSRFARPTHSYLTVNESTVLKGKEVVFAGKLTFGPDELPLASHPVRLESGSGDSWTTVANGLIAPDGTVSFTVKPSRTTTYRLSYAGVRPLGASISPAQTVTVKVPPPPPPPPRPVVTTSTYKPAGTGTIGANGVAASGTGAAVVAAAAAQSGKPYVYAASGPNAFDCSGLTMFVFAQFGVRLPHNADAQKSYGTPVSAADAAPGDLILFLDGGYAYHVGIYAGGGMMYDAPNSGSTVGLHSVYSSNVIFRRLV